MQPRHALTARLAELQSWRYGVTTQIARIADFTRSHGYSDADTEAIFDQLTDKANTARVKIIFVAEAGRGKSELINALFFSDLGRRLLPSGAAQATRCITEVRFDRDESPHLRVLPIESRETPRRFADLYADRSEWQTIPFATDDPESIRVAFSLLAQTRRATVAESVAWGLRGNSLSKPQSDSNGTEVPKWRYAVINFPHPILNAGLVVVDTPGISVLTAEPEFSREHIPAADAVFVVLDAAEGITKSDLAIWRETLGRSRNFRERKKDESNQARIIVVNKIDRLTSQGQVHTKEADRLWQVEIDKRIREVADLMGIESNSVIPVSTALALQGLFRKDQDVLLRSRLIHLERTLTDQLPADREVALGTKILNTLSSILESVQASLDQARFDVLTGLNDLGQVRKKNQAITQALSRETDNKRANLDAALDELRTIKAIHSKLSNELAELTSPTTAKQDIADTAMKITASLRPGELHDVLSNYFALCHQRIRAINKKLDEIRTLFGNLGEHHFRKIGIGNFELHPFATNRFRLEIDKVEEVTATELPKAGNTLEHHASAVAEQFEALIAGRIVHLFEIAHRESAAWMRGVLSAIEQPLNALNKRLEERATRVAVIRSAELDLAEKIAEIQAAMDVIKIKHAELSMLRNGLERFAGKRSKRD
ncbi:MAG: dynamin family protein [Burkholderiales bacterium]|jgi:predicted GTPase|nr:dynamin family protein [Rhodocyclaceae bacterium]MCA3041449.1 dynamin family protein [Rhodocyclaceae bacterium]MCA3053589.1 dynamin family protein [Rhodocyclaceae bacterium]